MNTTNMVRTSPTLWSPFIGQLDVTSWELNTTNTVRTITNAVLIIHRPIGYIIGTSKGLNTVEYDKYSENHHQHCACHSSANWMCHIIGTSQELNTTNTVSNSTNTMFSPFIMQLDVTYSQKWQPYYILLFSLTVANPIFSAHYICRICMLENFYESKQANLCSLC